MSAPPSPSPLPPHAWSAERVALTKLCHIPLNALRIGDFHLEDFGGPKLRSMKAMASSSLFRTAVKTVTHWKEWLPQLRSTAQEFLSIAARSSGECSPVFLDSSTFACE